MSWHYSRSRESGVSSSAAGMDSVAREARGQQLLVGRWLIAILLLCMCLVAVGACMDPARMNTFVPQMFVLLGLVFMVAVRAPKSFLAPSVLVIGALVLSYVARPI